MVFPLCVTVSTVAQHKEGNSYLNVCNFGELGSTLKTVYVVM